MKSDVPKFNCTEIVAPGYGLLKAKYSAELDSISVYWAREAFVPGFVISTKGTMWSTCGGINNKIRKNLNIRNDGSFSLYMAGQKIDVTDRGVLLIPISGNPATMTSSDRILYGHQAVNLIPHTPNGNANAVVNAFYDDVMAGVLIWEHRMIDPSALITEIIFDNEFCEKYLK